MREPWSHIIAYLKKNFRNAKGGSCAPRAIPGVGRRKQNQLAALDVLWKIARGAADPPIRPTAMLGDSEILSEKCSIAYLKKNFRYSMGAPWAGAQGSS